MNTGEPDDQRDFEAVSPDEYAENIAAVRASIRDYEAGERGTIAGEHSAVLRRGLDCTSS